jgi:hypothetical protein
MVVVPLRRVVARQRVDCLIVIPESRSDIRDPVPLSLVVVEESHWVTRRILRLALRAIGYADVRYGVLPAQPGFRRNDDVVALVRLVFSS